jgi:hypothetical protein
LAARQRRAQRVVVRHASSISASGDSPGGQTSSCIAMSAPSCPCTFIATSGERAWREPSRCDLKTKPSSLRVRRSASEKAWKPPESVSIA